MLVILLFRYPYDTPITKHFPVPKQHLLQEWTDPFYATFSPPTSASTSASLQDAYEEGDYYKEQESRFRPRRKRKHPFNNRIKVFF